MPIKLESKWKEDLIPLLKFIDKCGGRALETNIKAKMRPTPEDTTYYWLRVARDRFKWVELKKEFEGQELLHQNVWILTKEGMALIK